MSTPWSRYALACILLLALAHPGVAADTDGEAQALYRQALAHESAGQTGQAAALYERLLQVDPEHKAARRALGYELVGGYWLKGDELKRAKGLVHHDGRWLTAAEFAIATRPAQQTAAQKAGEAHVLGLLAGIASEDESRVRAAKRRLASVDEGFLLAPLAQALRCEPPSLRVWVSERLARLRDPLALPALLKRTIDDPDADVRAAAADAVRAIGTKDAIHPLGRALWSRHSDKSVRAAEALGRIGDVDAAAYVIARWEKRSGDFTRVYFAQARQISFLQDFDVEVASTSFIADPIVGVLQDGIVQDVRILATEVVGTAVRRVAYREALKRLSGEDHGDDVKAWRTWWNDRQP